MGTCMAYETGRPLGSFELDDPLVVKTATEMVERLLPALSLRPTVFHAELFDCGDAGLSLVEVAGRAGGAEIPAMWREVHGIDLLRVALDLQLGRPPVLGIDTPPGGGPEVGGWLLVPPTVARPCVVDDAHVDRTGKTVRFAHLPTPGTVIQAGGGYSHAARFRFAGATSATLEADIRSLAEGVRLDLMRRTHERLRVGSGVTHAEVRLTAGGPRLVELNCRLGGDFIPLLSRLATGVDLVACAGDIALGRPPRDRASIDRVAQVAFLYPPEDCTVEEVDLSASAAVEGIHAAISLASPGKALVLPPRGAVGRYAALVAVGDSVDVTDRAMADATALARFRGVPL